MNILPAIRHAYAAAEVDNDGVDGTFVELEVRLGQKSSPATDFEAYVPLPFFEACLQMAQQAPLTWCGTEPPTFILDLFYPNYGRVRQTLKNDDGLPADPSCAPQMVLKRRLWRQDVLIQHTVFHPHVGALRWAVATETPMAGAVMTAPPTHARLKQTTRFYYVARAFAPTRCLVLECSRVWSGLTAEVVRQAQRDWPQGQRHEIELEVQHPPYILQHPLGEVAGVYAMLWKVLDFYANFAAPLQPALHEWGIVEAE